MADPLSTHFDIVRPLSEGGFGIVHLVKRKNDNATRTRQTSAGDAYLSIDYANLADVVSSRIRTNAAFCSQDIQGLSSHTLRARPDDQPGDRSRSYARPPQHRLVRMLATACYYTPPDDEILP